MISLEDVLVIHKILIEQYGGSDGIRDQGLLESALERPFQTFDGLELYPSAIEKAAAIAESIIKNHPFIDGNKRTGYVLMRLILVQNKKDIEATQQEKYDFVIQIASGQIDLQGIRSWLEHRSINTT